ncbi:MAG: hypothetical protein ABW022_22615 [Actinoplanes sp.]
MPRTRHVGQRPGWNCQACGHPWPCAAAKGELAEAYRDRSGALTIHLGACLLEAIDDWSEGNGGPPADLYERFLGWATT